MSKALIEELEKENLCAYFVLPFLKLSKNNFTACGYVNTFLTEDRQRVAVKISDTSLLQRKLLLHPEFVAIYKLPDEHLLVMFRLVKKWQDDVKLFCEGKYSQLSTKAKEYIIRYSGLNHQKKEGDRVLTDGRLLALEKHPVLKGMWERELFSQTGKDQDDPDSHLPSELLSIPGESAFINPVGLTRIRETQL